MSEPICPTCKRERPPGWLKDMRKRQGQNISKALKASKLAGEQIGRKRTIDYQKVYELRDAGFSLMQISYKLNVSRGSIQNALRIRTPAAEERE